MFVSESVRTSYVPSIALAAVAMATFAAVLGVHSFYLIRQKRSRSFEALLVAGCVRNHAEHPVP